MNRQQVAQIVSEIPQGLDAEKNSNVRMVSDEFLIELAKRAFAFGLPKGQGKSFCREKNCGKMTSHVSGLCEKHRKHWLEGYKYAVYGGLK